MNRYFIFYSCILITLSFNLALIQSLNPTIQDYNCAVSFIKKFNFTTYYTKNSTDFYQLCYSQTSCYSNGSLNVFNAIADKELGITPGAKVIPQDLACFAFLDTIYLSSLTISDEFLYNKLPKVERVTLNKATLENAISQTLPSYSFFYIISSQMEGATIKLSYFNNINQVTIDNNYVYLERDLDAKTDKLKMIKFRSYTLPNLDGYIFDSIDLDFATTMNLADLDNFKYIKSTIVKFRFFNQVLPTPYFISNTYISQLDHYGQFQQATQIYDISVGYNYTSIKLDHVSKNFLYSNQVPIAINSKQNLFFATSDSTSSVLIPSPSSIGLFKSISVQSSSLSGDLPPFNGSGLAYDFSFNKITGTIDKSWCGTNLYVRNNQLTGTIPSCFTCHFNSTLQKANVYGGSTYFTFFDFYSVFSGNQFSNYNIQLPCTTMAPQIRYYNSTTFIISGTDIGFDPYNFFINASTPCASNPTAVIKYGYEYYCNVGWSLVGVKYLSIWFRFVDSPNKRIQYFPLVSHPLVITSINISSNSILLEGSYFSSYVGHSVQTITIGDNYYDCIVDSSSFFKASCVSSVSLPISTSESSLLTMINGNQTKKVYIKTTDGAINNKGCPNDCVNNSTHGGMCDMSSGQCRGIECPNECSGNGICNKLNGVCACSSKYQSADCSVPFNECAIDTSNGNECWGRGSCNNVTGICKCDDGFLLDDCSGIQCDDPTCGNGNGQCQFSSGKCLCKNEWSGVNCLVTIHYVSSVLPSFESGGNASFIGFFAYAHDNLTIKIGDKDCIPSFVSNNIINCNAPAGKGIHNINITQNGISFIGNDLYRYKVLEGDNNNNGSQNCANNCSNNGICSAGICECNSGFGSYDCSTLTQDQNQVSTLPPTTVDVDEETGSVVIINEKTNFKIYIRSLYEVDIMGKTIKTYQLNSNMSISKPSPSSSSSSSSVYSFIQQFEEGFTVNSTIETISASQGKEFNFADINFKLDKDSIKFTFTISNYTYQSFLNTLKLEFISVANDTYQENEDDCNKSPYSNSDSNIQYDFNYIKVEKNNKIMIGRFINIALSDSKPTFISSSISNEGDSMVYTIGLPHFVNQIVIDPDFSVLLSADFSSCSSPNENNKWKIPISIIIPVCVAGALGFIVFKYRKNSFIKINGKKIKLNSIK